MRAKFGVECPSSADTKEAFQAPAYRLREDDRGILVIGSRGATRIPWGSVKYARYEGEQPEDVRPARGAARAPAAG